MLRFAAFSLLSAPLLLVACGGDVTTSTGSASTGGGSTSNGTGASTTGTMTSGGGSTTNGTTTGTTGPGATTSTGGGCGSCMQGFICCNAQCVNAGNDIHNCGGCGTTCPGPSPFCDNGTCGKPPCNQPNGGCSAGQTCCDAACCKPGELCCNIPGPVETTVQCTPPTAEGTCPAGCTECVCASPDTAIATPDGERPIASLEVGDLVYSVDHGALRPVPIRAVHRVPAAHHAVVRLVLETGRVLEISPRHPTADGRTFAELHAGDRLDGVAIVEAVTIPYAHDATYDVLPASDTGTYVAGGVVIGSTLHGRDVAR